ncbi:MAG TPA: DUF3488 and transglutaminase-like domain-containing protein [Tepidisphaeraceae bacterium]|nr:DUF3488 and transglutaminase-like domain-containing protein [Tepidisphaeraceae bacterium]
MYDIRQFKPALYLLLLLGFSGFALAAESPAAWVLGVGPLSISAYLVWRGRFRPMPRFLSNVITLLALLYVLREVFIAGATPILVIGEFLVLLQVVKIWEQRGNRDWAQLLVLSLLLMVAASINTASLLFGVLMVVYLVVSLYCCLLFHLKVETDNARAAMALSCEHVNPATLRQDQRYLTRSMRRLTLLVSIAALISAVATFVLFPRGAGAGLLGPLQFKPSQTLVGFSDEVNFQNIARIQQNNSIVADVGVVHNGVEVRGGAPLLLRGLTYDHYTGSGHRGGGAWRWLRTDSQRGSVEMFQIDRDETANFVTPSDRLPDEWLQNIRLTPTGTNVLFAMGGPVSIRPRHALKVRFTPRDGVLLASELPAEPLEYEVVSSGSLGNDPPARGSGTPPANIDPKIGAYARRAQVSGTNAAGLLADQRKAGPGQPDALDEQIARNIERHLKTQFAYTLDLTDTRRIEGRDPLVAFLYDFKKGHCEYFAGAMTLMCQSLGMQARYVAGFHCDEFNGTPGAGYYIVRQSHAHAWVEVRTPEGWETFDPTSDRDAAEQVRKAGAWQKVKHLFNFLEFTYANAVIAYSNEDRANLIQRTETAMVNTVIRSSRGIDDLRRLGRQHWLNYPLFWKLASGALFMVMAAMSIAALAVIGRYALDKWRLRRRAARIGIGSLPPGEQLRLARQLGFYDDLLRLLWRHQIARPRHQTPLEFSRSLLFLPADAYEHIRRLTELFYRVRYGRAQLSPGRQRLLGNIIARLDAALVARSAISRGK